VLLKLLDVWERRKEREGERRKAVSEKSNVLRGSCSPSSFLKKKKLESGDGR